MGRDLEFDEAEAGESDPTAGIVLIRVFGGIGAVLVFALLAFYLFRRFVNREARTEELRESLWSEADVAGDLLAALRGLGDRFRRVKDERVSDAPNAELYFDVLKHAETKGQTRAVHRHAAAVCRCVGAGVSQSDSEADFAGVQQLPVRRSAAEPGRAELNAAELGLAQGRAVLSHRSAA